MKSRCVREIEGTASIVIEFFTNYILATDQCDDQHRYEKQAQFAHFDKIFFGKALRSNSNRKLNWHRL